MSWRQVVKTIRAQLVAQLAADVATRAAAESIVMPPGGVLYTEWETPITSLRRTDKINIQITAPIWDAAVATLPAYMRDAMVPIEIIFRYVSPPSQTQRIADVLGIYAESVAKVLDSLRAYSDANGGTVQNVPGRYRFENTSLPGTTDQAAVNGWILTFTVQERGGV